MRVMNPTLLLRKLKSQGVDVRFVYGGLTTQVQAGLLNRALRGRSDVRQTLWLSKREDEARKAADRWRCEYQWRMLASWAKWGPVIGAGITFMGAVLKAYVWPKLATLSAEEAIDAPPDP